MTDDELVSEALLVLDGGAETTRSVIGTMCVELIRHPDQRALLIDDPSILATTGVEEFIRWVSPLLNMARTATEDHELHGVDIKAGDELLLMYASANRDERVFDDPERFDVQRAHNLHVAFGFGTHFCLGASLARLEIQVMFEELLRRTSRHAARAGSRTADRAGRVLACLRRGSGGVHAVARSLVTVAREVRRDPKVPPHVQRLAARG